MGWDVRRTRCTRPRPCCLLRCRWELDSGPLGDAFQQLSSLWIKVPEVSASRIRVVDRAIRCKRNPPWSGIFRGQGVLPNRHCLRVNTAQDPRSLDGEIICLDRRGESQFYALMFRRGPSYFYAFDLIEQTA